jgi:tetratricopeptide (TPR) repeat protein
MASKKEKKTKQQKSPAIEKQDEQNAGTGKKQYPKWFYAIPFVVIVLFFLLLEGGLRLAGYGADIPVFREYANEYPGYLFFNPDITAKYFSTAQPSLIFDGFRKEKLPNTIRIFVLGESSAAGWPYHPNAAFPWYIRSGLEQLYPDRHIEVINLGVSAVNTYLMRDILPSVLEQKPDMLLIYTGHNEYYGAMGVGSTQTMGKSRAIINFLLAAQKYRTVQLIQNIIRGAAGVFSSGEKETNSTLMERVVGESSIPYHSALFESGLNQFAGNMGDILEACNDAHVPVVIASLASNLKDQPPLVNAEVPGFETAEKVFTRAQAAYAAGDFAGAKKLFVQARDLDALRFRAPSEINELIRKLASEYKATFVDVEAALSAVADHGIIGREVMTDHLHPNLRGYQIIGKTFLSALLQNNLLPPAPHISVEQIDRTIASEFPFTRLDSLYVDLRLRVLLGAYPFVPKGQANHLVESFAPRNHVDSLAAKVVLTHELGLEEAHYGLADYYLRQRNLDGFEQELSALISENIIDPRPYKKLIQGLMGAGLYDRAIPYLLKMERHCGNAQSAETIGSIYLMKKAYQQALPYLEKAVQLDGSDPSSWYNLAVAYYSLQNGAKAGEAVTKALAMQPQNEAARALKDQIGKQFGRQ